MKSVRARRLGSKPSDLYEFYPSRALYEEEFEKIWKMQATHDPDIFHEEAKTDIFRSIFYQRPLKPPKIGLCSFIPDEVRIAHAMPSYQEFRIIQEVINLSWRDDWLQETRIATNTPLFDQIVRELNQKKSLSFTAMAKMMRKLNLVDYTPDFNLASEKRKALDGNLTSHIMRDDKRFGAQWDSWPLETQDEIISHLLDDALDDEDLAALLRANYGVENDEQCEAIIDAPLPSGHGSLSKAAIDKILPIMKVERCHFDKAVKAAGFGAHNFYDADKPLDQKLRYYGEVLTTDVLPGTGDPNDRDEVRFGAIPNPTVHIALNQIRTVVNDIIRRYGAPHEIVVELARDLPLGAEGRKDITQTQAKNQEANQRIDAICHELGVTPTRLNRQKQKLWEGLSQDPTNRRCVFTGRMISQEELFSSAVEIEHLLPFSRTLDDSLMNKTVCFQQANRDKGNQSPYEAFGHSPSGYHWQNILSRIEKWPRGKKWRFEADAMARFDDDSGFLNRQLNDTRYIARYTRKYLASIVPENDIWVVTGRLTSLLRGHWGLNAILRGDNTTPEEQRKKQRDDHRHHAIDAIVIAMTSRRMLQQVAAAARRGEELEIERLFEHSREIDPWPNFRDDVQKVISRVIVSHRPRKKNQGALHRETAYGAAQGKAVKRVDISTIMNAKDVAKIKDDDLRASLAQAVNGLSGQPFKLAAQEWAARHEIKRLKCFFDSADLKKMIPVSNKKGHVFKYLEAQGNAYMDIYVDEAGKWQGEVVTRFNANQANFIPNWRRQFPTKKRLMQLRIDDVIEMTKDGARQLFRVQKMTTGQITFTPLHEANCDARARDKNDSFAFTFAAPSALQKAKAVKCYVSPTGLVRRDE